MSDIKVRIERIGPKMAQVYSKELNPRRSCLIQVGWLPPDSRVNDEVVIKREFLIGNLSARQAGGFDKAV